VSAAAAGAVAVRTAAQLNKILPVDGKGRAVYILIKSTTYAEQTSFLMGRKGYYYFAVRGTCTDATAASTAFLDDAADRNMNGNVTATGMNAAGYNPTGVPTNQVIQCLKVGGAAPGFAAEVPIALPGGARIRFDSATTTAALRGIRRSVVKVAGTDTLTVDRTLPAVPVASDTFYIEMPGAIFLSLQGSCDGPPTSGVNQYSVAGLQANGGTAGANRMQFVGPWALAQCWYSGVNASNFNGGTVNFGSTWVGPTGGASIDTFGASRSNGGFTIQGGLTQILGGVGPYSNTLSVTRAAGRVEIENSFVTVGGLTYSQLSGTAQTNAANTDPDCIGTNPARIAAGAFISRILSNGLTIGADTTIGGLSVEGATAAGAVQIVGVGIKVCIVGPLSGTTGNTVCGFDLTNAQGCTIFLPSLPTVTGTSGDVKLADGTIITWAQAQAGIVDAAGNRLFGANATPTQALKFSGGLLGGAGATTSYLADTGAAPAANLTAIEYPISQHYMTRLRVKPEANTFATNVVATVFKNGVATALTVTIPAGSTAVVSDTAHSALFADGDLLAIVLSNAGDAAKTISLMAVVEGPA